MLTWPSRHVLCALFLGTAACGEADSPRRDVLAHLADEVIAPAHADLAASAKALPPALAALCAAPGDRPLADAQAAWRAVHADWSVVQAFAFGPVVTQKQAAALDFWPVRTDTVDAKIAGAPAQIDAAYIDGLGTSAKGLPALEYLLFAGPLADDPVRCAYATALAEDIARRTAALADAWQAEHADALRTSGRGSAVYDSEQAGLDAVVNAAIEGLYGVVKGKLDRPLGNLGNGEADPRVVESPYSATALANIGHNLDGLERLYLGADLEPGGDPGLGALVAARDDKLDARILAQFASARSALAAVPGPLQDALLADRSSVQTARDEIDALRRLIKLDVASLLGVTLMLSDNDGD